MGIIRLEINYTWLDLNRIVEGVRTSTLMDNVLRITTICDYLKIIFQGISTIWDYKYYV